MHLQNAEMLRNGNIRQYNLAKMGTLSVAFWSSALREQASLVPIILTAI